MILILLKNLMILFIQLEDLGSFEKLEELGGISLLNPIVGDLEDRGILEKYQRHERLEPQEAQDLIAFLTSCVDFLRQQSAMT